MHLLPLLILVNTARAAAIDDLLTWADDNGLSAWAEVLRVDLEDPKKHDHLAAQLAVESAWRTYVAETRRPELQLVDVVPSDPGWQARPLEPDDARRLERYLRDQLGRRVRVRLVTIEADYRSAFAEKTRELPQGIVITASEFTSPVVDLSIPVIYTYAAYEDETGRRVVVSASGGRPDQRAMVGSAARPIGPENTWLYTHELLHALGILHHLRNDVYSDSSNYDFVVETVIGADCLMSAGYVGGVRRGLGANAGEVDGQGRRRMLDAVCPICRYLLNPQGRWQGRYARRYVDGALWLEPRPGG